MHRITLSAMTFLENVKTNLLPQVQPHSCPWRGPSSMLPPGQLEIKGTGYLSEWANPQIDNKAI